MVDRNQSLLDKFCNNRGFLALLLLAGFVLLSLWTLDATFANGEVKYGDVVYHSDEQVPIVVKERREERNETEQVTLPALPPIIKPIELSRPRNELSVVDAHALQMDWRGHERALRQVANLNGKWRNMSHVPALLGARGSSWSLLCQYLVPVEAGIVRGSADAGLDGEVADWEDVGLDAARRRVESVGVLYTEVHTDVCVGLAGAVGVGEFRRWNPGADAACGECSVRSVAAADASSAWTMEISDEEEPGVEIPRSAVFGVGEFSLKLASEIRTSWVVGDEGGEVAIGASEELESWMATGRVSKLKSFAERIVVLWDESIGSDAGVLDRLLRLASRRHCADILLVQSEALVLGTETQEAIDTNDLRRAYMLPEQLYPVSPQAVLESLADFLAPSHLRLKKSFTAPPPPAVPTESAVFLPTVAFLRSWCRPQPGAGPLCRSMEYTAKERRVPTQKWDAPRPELTFREQLKRPPLRFIHIHKAAGTSMCETAIAEEENCNGNNCNSDLSRWCTAAVDLHSCDIVAGAAPTKTTYIATEHAIEQPLCDALAIYFTVLRDPIDLASSSLPFHHLNDPKTIDKMLNTKIITKVNPRPSEPINPQAPKCYMQLPNVRLMFDNFQIRILLGNAGRRIPLGEIGTIHLERAKATLRRLCVVGVVGSLTDSNPAIAKAVGWTPKKKAIHANSGSYKSKVCMAKATKQQKQTIIQSVQLDVELLQYARTIKPHVGAPENMCTLSLK